MAVYRQIHISFWQDPFIAELTPEEKYFYLYLMTNSKTKQCGIYEISKKMMVFETGYNSDTIDKLIARFTEYGKIKYNEGTKELFIINWLKYNFSISPKIKTCIENELKSVKYQPFQSHAIEYIYSIHSLSIDLGEEKEKEKEKEEEKEEKEEEKKEKRSAELFDVFWLAYPKKAAKKDALKAWQKMKPDEELANTIIEAVKQRSVSAEWTKNNGEFIPLPATYLRGERWKDEAVKKEEKRHPTDFYKVYL